MVPTRPLTEPINSALSITSFNKNGIPPIYNPLFEGAGISLFL